MGLYVQGDVVLASVSIDDRNGAKTRPAVVIGMNEDGDVVICPVSSKPSFDAPCIPLSIDDFSTGGLDLFSESFILTSRIAVIRNGDVIGKRGRLTDEYVQEIITGIPVSQRPGATCKSPPFRSRKPG
ncbi:MAG: type II toxin-antitoxin system PemK/MazF family toxin [Methanoregula sp.]|nr:type II toxin-antitoxin system PemK/MazF family toxin [Methanoregula sp.]